MTTNTLWPQMPAAGEIWPDDRGVHINAHGGGILRHQGVYYWFGEHKIAGSAGNAAHVGVHVYSSQDLRYWQNCGIALQVSSEAGSPLEAGCVLERPKVLYNAASGKFVMWFHLELKGQGYEAALSGVATADVPTGPYRFIECFRPNSGVWPENVPPELRRPLDGPELARLGQWNRSDSKSGDYPGDLLFRRDFAGGQMARDMTLFLDEDGSAYHIYASEHNGTLHISQLREDFLRPGGRYMRFFVGQYNEAPALFKRRGKYYLITSDCTGWLPNPARCAVADSIWGPWEFLGNPCVGPGADKTFGGQSTYVLGLDQQRFIFMADRWTPENAIDGRYLWLPIEFDAQDRPIIHMSATGQEDSERK